MNPIADAFLAALDSEKQLYRVHPDIQPTQPRKVTLEYKDGSNQLFTVDLPHKEFMNEWKRFGRWFRSFRESDIRDIED